MKLKIRIPDKAPYQLKLRGRVFEIEELRSDYTLCFKDEIGFRWRHYLISDDEHLIFWE